MSEKAKTTSKKQFKNMFYKKSSKPQKKPKLNIVFDEASRVDFLTGFHKRKLQRKTDQKLKLEKQLAAEKQRIRAQAKKSVGKLCNSHSILPEVEHLLNMSSTKLEPSESMSKSITLGTKIVTISSLENIHMKLPPMKEEESGESDNAAADEDDVNDHDDEAPAKGGNNVKSMLKKATNRLLQSSKAYKTSQKIKQKSKKRKSRKNPNFVPKRDGIKKGDDSKSTNPSFRKGKGKKGQKKKGKS